ERRLRCAARRSRHSRAGDERCRELCRARQKLVASIRWRDRERGLEQLPDDAEGELALELAAACTQHLEPSAARDLLRRTDKPGLPDPGTSFDGDQAAVAARYRIDHHLQRSDLGLALEQRP